MTTSDDGPRPADPVDDAVAELLDVQGDLGDICSWLQAAWPANLPMPYLEGRSVTRGNLAELWVQCSTPDVLGQAADVLGAEVGDDPLLDGYRSAIRRFGTVDVVAWCKVPDADDEVAY